ncbi:uncharacterized protein LOC134470130 [Engraulis encrasicolus]|uniref:uncharacterized protein LOC134470130 n=1 Tax=Engraulis encrasicolus TaxID=184585 RepID=UPI002FD6E975
MLTNSFHSWSHGTENHRRYITMSSPVLEEAVFQTPRAIGGDRCPVLGSAETACLSPIKSAKDKESVLVETCDEGYITRSFTQDLPFTPVISTPMRPQKDPDADKIYNISVVPVTQFCIDETEYSWESTLLNVQVKSEVVAVPPKAETSVAAVSPFKAGRRVTPPASKRPKVFQHPEEWQQEKDRYMQAVTRHMREKPKGVMNELLDLMNTVASEAAAPWQHPSDLTTRNYKSAGEGLYSLEEWKAKNGGDWRRFSPVIEIL